MIARIAIAIILSSLMGACARPRLGPVAEQVVSAVKGLSESVSTILNGGFTLDEAKSCQQLHISMENLELPTKAKVNIFVTPSSFSLYTQENAWTDFSPDTWYEVDLNSRMLEVLRKSGSDWVRDFQLELPPYYFEGYLNDLSPRQERKALTHKNPFSIPRKRLGVRLSLSSTIIGERDSDIALSPAEEKAVFCAGALNAYFEALLKTAYVFKK